MFVTTASGFADTPITRLWCYVSLGVPIFISLAELQYLFVVQIQPQLTEWHQWWRLPMNQLLYTNQSEVLLSVLFIYNMRVLERLLGSHKYLSFLALVYLIGSITVPALAFVLSTVSPASLAYNLNSLPSSQTVVLSALLYLYHELVPVVYRFELTPAGSTPKAQFSDKIFIYFIAFQLLSFHFGSFVVQFIIGWTLSSLIHNELVPGKTWRFPFYRYLHLEKDRRDTASTVESRGLEGATMRSDTIDGGNDTPTNGGATNGGRSTEGLSSQILSVFRH